MMRQRLLHPNFDRPPSAEEGVSEWRRALHSQVHTELRALRGWLAGQVRPTG